jgi:CBS domain-containing protein
MTTRPDQTISTIMSWPVATIEHQATLVEAAEALAADTIGALVVLHEGGLVGVLSERDVVVHVAAGANLSHLLVEEVMATDVVTVQADATITEAARTMVDSEIRHLPVMQGNLIAGVVSIRDVVAVLASAAPEDDVLVVPSGTRVLVVGN